MLGDNRLKSQMNITNNKVSVIVPIYNAQRYLHRCIKSILEQDYTNFELILVDDGSTDMSGEICEKYKLVDSRIQVIHKSNEGVSVARNIGIDLAKGEFITFVDADDWIDSSYLSSLLKKICGYDIVISSFTDVYESNTPKRDYNKELNCPLVTKDAIFESFVDDCIEGKIYTYLIWGKLYRKSIIGQVRFSNLKYSEDALFFRSIVNKGARINFVENHGYYYYINKEGATSDRSKATEIVYGSMYMLQSFYKLFSSGMSERQKKETIKLIRRSLLAYLRSAVKTGNIVTPDAYKIAQNVALIIFRNDPKMYEILYIGMLLLLFQIRGRIKI